MNDPKDKAIAHLIVVGIDMTRTLQAIGHDQQGKQLQEMWSSVSAMNNGVVEVEDHQMHQQVRLLCFAIKLAADTVTKHYKE